MRLIPALAAAGATLAFGAALTRSETAAIARRHTARGRFVSIGATRLHVLETGNGPPVLLVHGNAVTAEDWRLSGVFDALARAHRVIAPDRPGYGFSERPSAQTWSAAKQATALAALLRQLDAAPAIVVAHSIGVQTALHLALDHAEVVRGLVLVSGYYFESARPDAALAALIAAPAAGDLLRHTLGTPLAHVIAKPSIGAMFSPRSAPDAFLPDVFEMGLRPTQMHAQNLDGAAMPGEAKRLAERYPELAPRTVVIAGGRDKIVSADKQSVRFATAAPNATYRVLSGEGHMLHYAQTDAVVEAVDGLT